MAMVALNGAHRAVDLRTDTGADYGVADALVQDYGAGAEGEAGVVIGDAVAAAHRAVVGDVAAAGGVARQERLGGRSS